MKDEGAVGAMALLGFPSFLLLQADWTRGEKMMRNDAVMTLPENLF